MPADSTLPPRPTVPDEAPQEAPQEAASVPKRPGALNPNRARDHLANERTYLAWIRTAVTLFSFGVLIVRLRYLMPAAERHAHGWQIGLLFSLVGLLMVLLAHGHYFAVARSIEADTYQPTTRWVTLCTGAIIVLGAAVLYLLMAPVSPPPSLPAATPHDVGGHF